MVDGVQASTEYGKDDSSRKRAAVCHFDSFHLNFSYKISSAIPLFDACVFPRVFRLPFVHIVEHFLGNVFFWSCVLLLQQWLVVSFHCVLCLIWLSSSDNYRQIWLREYFNNCTFVHTSSRVEFAHKTHNHTASVCNVEIVIIYIYPQTRWPGIYEIHIKYQDNWSKHLLPNAE